MLGLQQLQAAELPFYVSYSTSRDNSVGIDVNFNHKQNQKAVHLHMNHE
jgi:hypothetical protein